MRVFVYRPPVVIEVEGATSPNGKPYVLVATSGKRAWIPRGAFTGGGGEARNVLKAMGMPLLSEEWKRCKEAVAKLERYPLKPLIDRAGWNGRHFALADGTVFSPLRSKCPEVLFPANGQKCAAAGSIEEWLTITACLEHQQIATFVLLAAYASPFLILTNQTMNFGFELAGPGGIGKSTIQRFAAAVCGPTDSPQGTNYWINANSTIHGLERVMAEHQDMVLIIEESNLYAAADHAAKRAAKFNELVFKLADGTEKRRFSLTSPRRFRFVYITSSNEPLFQVLIGHRVDVAEAAGDRLLTIPISGTRPFGIFDSVPDTWPNARAFADFLNEQVRRCHGVGIRHLLDNLVAELANNPENVAKRLQRSLRYFRRKAGVDENDGSETRAADAFGLVYAAGKCAIRYGAVSNRLDPLHAALTCFRLNKATRTKRPSPIKQVLELADQWDTLWVSFDKLPQLTDAEIEDAPAIVREGPGERRELLLTERQLLRKFDNLRAFFSDNEVRRIWVREDGRRQTKRQFRRNRKAERVFCFRLPG